MKGCSIQRVIRFCCRGLDYRCDRYFRSLIKLVGPRTETKWVYDDANYDLLVSPEPPEESERKVIIWRKISHFTQDGSADCALLRGDSVESELLKIEHECDGGRVSQGVRRKRAGVRKSAFQLKRWPPSAVLAGDSRLHRLATLMLSRPLTVAELATISGVSERQCSELVARLRKAALLSEHDAERSEPQPAQSSNRGLFDMIRKRLGIDRGVE